MGNYARFYTLKPPFIVNTFNVCLFNKRKGRNQSNLRGGGGLIYSRTDVDNVRLLVIIAIKKEGQN